MDDTPAPGNGSRTTATRALRALELPASILEAVAKAKGKSSAQLITNLLTIVVDAALAGDVEAALAGRTLLVGPMLNLGRARSSRSLYKRITRALDAGLISAREARELLPLVEAKRSLEADNLEQRLRTVQGSVESRKVGKG